MALSIVHPPRSPALSGDPNWMVLETTLSPGGTRPGFLVSGTPSSGDELNLRWGNTVVKLNFVATVTESTGGTSRGGDRTYQVLAAGGQSAADYRSQLVEAFYAVPEIEASFIITERDDGVRLELRNATNGDVAATSSPGVSVTVFASDVENSYPNLSAAVSLYRVGSASPLRLRPTYGADRRAEVDMAHVLPLRLGVPPQQYVVASGAYGAFQPEGWGEYYLRYADQYGRPPQAEVLQKSDTFAVVAGSSGGRSLYRWGIRGGIQLCHAYINDRTEHFAKPVTYEQPDWVYIYSDAGGSVTPFVTVLYSDGSNDRFQVPGGGAQSLSRGLYAWPSGPSQLQLDTAPGWATKTPVRYVFELAGSTVRVSYELVRECYPWEMYLAYENGCGGIESVTMRGKPVRSFTATKEGFRRAGARTQVQSRHFAEQGQINAEGVLEHRLRSGYVSRDYARHLAQLMVGRVWIVDTVHRRFVPVTAAPGTLKLTEADDDLHAIEITVREAKPGGSAHHL